MFVDYHRVLAKDCFKGRVELKNLVGKVDLALGDARYNEAELKELGFAQTGVLPLVMDFEKFSRPVVPVIRDIFVILLGFELFVIGITTVLLIFQTARLINMFQHEIKPVLEAANESMSEMMIDFVEEV